MVHNTATGLSRIGCSGNYTVKISKGGGTVDLAGEARPPFAPLAAALRCVKDNISCTALCRCDGECRQ